VNVAEHYGFVTDQDRLRELFFNIHRDPPREGPGDDASTRRALNRVVTVTRVARFVDVGCGPGTQTIALASAADALVCGLDTHSGYLEQLRSRAEAAGWAHRIVGIQASMFAMPFLPATIDLIWAEGSIYIIGFERGLQEWQELLRVGGCLAVTHLSWLTPEPPDSPRRFWARHFPAMATVDENLHVALRCGYDVLEHFTLPSRRGGTTTISRWSDGSRCCGMRTRRIRRLWRSSTGLNTGNYVLVDGVPVVSEGKLVEGMERCEAARGSVK
jgi:SAM-dependent methyltransferase